MTFTFGLALPLLFPIAAFTFFNIYIMERLTVMYFHPTPPMYDDQLIKLMLTDMKWAPVFMIFFGFWYLGQPSIFNNVAIAVDYSFEPVRNDHTAKPLLGPELPMFIASMIICFTFVIYITGILNRLAKCCCKFTTKLGIGEDTEKQYFIDEGLCNYFESMAAFDRKNDYLEEFRSRMSLKIKTYSNFCIFKLKDANGSETSTGRMMRPYTYDILNDPHKQEEFCYTPIKDRSGKQGDAMNDLIIKSIYYGFYN